MMILPIYRYDAIEIPEVKPLAGLTTEQVKAQAEAIEVFLTRVNSKAAEGYSSNTVAAGGLLLMGRINGFTQIEAQESPHGIVPGVVAPPGRRVN